MADENSPVQQNMQAEGTGIAQAQAYGQNAKAIAIFGFPLEKLLISALIASLFVQLLTCVNISGSVLSHGRFSSVSALGFFSFLTMLYCFPPIFGIIAMIGLFYGFQVKNSRLKKLSIATGICAVLPWLLLCTLSSILEEMSRK